MAGDLDEDEFASELEGDFLGDEELALLDEAVTIALGSTASTSSNVKPASLCQEPDPSASVDHKYGSDQQSIVPSPLEQYRGYLGYVSVSDLVSQFWCEQQMEYGYSAPQLLPPTPQHVQQGADIHMAKELELYDIVPVNITSKEDKWAVRCLNFLTQIAALDARQTVRELPVFGEPYNMGVFLYGIIDELRFNSKGQLELLELKTRSSECRSALPSRAQQSKNSLQALIYRKLFNDLISGKVRREQFLKYMSLSGEKELSSEPINVAKGYGLECKTLGCLLDIVFHRLETSELPEIGSLVVEYVSQQNCKSLCRSEVKIEENWLKSQFLRMMPYWKGERSTVGIDIEEAWKCQRCDFADICVWRKKKDEECRKGNSLKYS